MPTLYFHIPEVHTGVIDPVASQIVDAIIRDMNTKAAFNHQNITISSDHLSDAGSSDENSNIRITGDRCDVKMEVVSNPHKIRWDILNFSNVTSHGVSSRGQGDRFPLFSDGVAGVTAYEQSVPCNLNLEFAMKFTDKEDARRAESAIYTRYHSGAVFNNHDLKYSYPLSIQIVSVLYTFYKMRSAYYNVKHFVEYLRENASSLIAFETAKADANKRRLVVERIQLQSLAMLEYDQERPEPVTVNQITDRWEVRFRYTVQFTRPDVLSIHFPSVIENALVPADVIPETAPTTFTMRNLEGILAQKSYNTFLRENSHISPANIIRLPVYDEFMPTRSPATVYKYKPFLIAAFTLDAGITSIPLNGIEDAALHPTVVEIMKKQGSDIFSTVGLFNVSVYSNGTLVNPKQLQIDDSLNLVVNMSDTLKRYHLVISEATDLRHISDVYMKVLIENRAFFAMVIAKNLQVLINKGRYVVVPSHPLVETITKLMRKNTLDGYIAALIAGGHTTTMAYQYAGSAYQFAEFISSFRSSVTEEFLYKELVEMWLTDGVVRADSIPAPQVKTRSGVPISLERQELINGPFTPLRISSTRFVAE